MTKTKLAIATLLLTAAAGTASAQAPAQPGSEARRAARCGSRAGTGGEARCGSCAGTGGEARCGSSRRGCPRRRRSPPARRSLRRRRPRRSPQELRPPPRPAAKPRGSRRRPRPRAAARRCPLRLLRLPPRRCRAAAAAAPPPMPQPKPSKELEAFMKPFEGSWKCDTKFFANAMGPGSPEMTVKSKVAFKKEMGGMFYRGDYETKKQKGFDMSMKGIFYIGWDPGTQQVIVTASTARAARRSAPARSPATPSPTSAKAT